MCQSRLQHTIGTHRGNSEENLRKGLSADVEADLREPNGDIGAPRTLAAAGGCFLSEVERARGRDGVTEPAEELVQKSCSKMPSAITEGCGQSPRGVRVAAAGGVNGWGSVRCWGNKSSNTPFPLLISHWLKLEA